MGRIPEATISEIRSRVDIVDFVGRHLELKRAGRNYKACCPFHNEKTPSFNVNPERQIFHCFGCGAGGDVVGFLMQHENLTFPEAVRTLARECGVEVPETESGERGESERCFAAMEIAQRVYVDALASAEGEAARAYLERRGLGADAIREFGIGFAPDRWDAVEQALARHGKGELGGEFGARAGLLAERRSGGGYYDRLRGRVVFPIYDVRRRIIGFGGRALGADQEPKYLNTPESPIFHKREALYGFPWALEAIRRSERAIVCEGYFDRIALHRAELAEGLATCGTSLTREHGKQLRRRTREVVLLFDGDAAGQKAVDRALEVLLPEGLRVRAAALPEGQDPDDFLGERGSGALRSLVDAAPDALELVIGRAAATGCATPGGKADAVGAVAPLVAIVPDPVEREAWGRRLALATDTSEAAVASVVRSTRKGASAPDVDLAEARPRSATVEDRWLASLARLLMQHPQSAHATSREELESVLPSGPGREAALALHAAATSGALDAASGPDPLAIAEGLGVDARAVVHAAATADVVVSEDREPAAALRECITSFEKRLVKVAHAEIARRMQDPSLSEGERMELFKEYAASKASPVPAGSNR